MGQSRNETNSISQGHTLCRVPQVAEGALFNLKHLSSGSLAYGVPVSLLPLLPWSMALEEAKLFWSRGEPSLATRMMKALLQKLRVVREQERRGREDGVGRGGGVIAVLTCSEPRWTGHFYGQEMVLL